jgi:hypothetical protein
VLFKGSKSMTSYYQPEASSKQPVALIFETLTLGYFNFKRRGD